MALYPSGRIFLNYAESFVMASWLLCNNKTHLEVSPNFFVSYKDFNQNKEVSMFKTDGTVVMVGLNFRTA